MTDSRDVAEILGDISVLYELSLSVGQSVELHENCDQFLRTLMACKSLDFASVWIRDRVASGEEDGSGDRLTQVYATPTFRAPVRVIPGAHPLVDRVQADEFFSVTHGDDGFAEIVTEASVDRGTFAVYRLGNIGILKLYSIARDTRFSHVELSKLRHVVEKFTVSVEGCLDHARVRAAEQRRRELELQMLHAQKLESMGLLAGGLAHDFNNLLTVVLGNAELVRPLVGPGGAEHLDNIIGSAVRAADLCSQLLAYSGRGRFVSGPLLLNEVVEEILRLAAVGVSKKAEVVCEMATEMPAIDGDPTQIRQVVMNLVTNASEAMGDVSGELRVATGIAHLSASELAEFTLGVARAPGRYAYLDVQDTGCGIDSEARQRLFDPFFTTKFTGRGLGLAAVLGIVRGHHGAIRVRSRVDQGTGVRVLFPLSTAPAGTPVEVEVPEAAGNGGCVLVADDEPNVRALLGRLVQDLGYAVLFAPDGGQALETYMARRGEIDLVILDLTMPVMGGDEVFERIARLDPEARVVLTSGYSEAQTRLEGPEPSAFLAKPFRAAEVHGIIRSVLREQGIGSTDGPANGSTNGTANGTNPSTNGSCRVSRVPRT